MLQRDRTRYTPSDVRSDTEPLRPFHQVQLLAQHELPFRHFLKRFYTPISTIIARKRINLFMPHPTRMAQKLDPEQKLTGAVQLTLFQPSQIVCPEE